MRKGMGILPVGGSGPHAINRSLVSTNPRSKRRLDGLIGFFAMRLESKRRAAIYL